MPAAPLVFEETHMHTRVTVTVHPGSALRDWTASAAAAFAEFEKLEKVFSLFRPDSEIVTINACAGLATAVSPEFMSALKSALAVAAETGGRFDPLVGRFTAPGFVGRDLPAATFDQIVIDDASGRVTLPPRSVLDLNAIVKGLALDRALAAFADDAAVIIEAGGDLAVKRLPPGQDAWDIGIRDPRHPELIAAVIKTASGAVCTSGNYFRAAAARAVGREHLVDARDGRNGDRAGSLTVFAPSAAAADILSTAAFLLPPGEVPEFVESHAGAACLAIAADGEVQASPRLAAALINHRAYA
ncbi:MAG: FAD:protein FMN transferase [Patescibacteria group bacterium]